MGSKRKTNSDPEPASYWRHMPSGELYKVALVAANPCTGERSVIFSRPESPREYFLRSISDFQKRFTMEQPLARADGL